VVDINLVLLTLLSLALIVMGLFVLLKSRNEQTNQYFFVITIAIAGWILTNYFSNSSALSPAQLLLFNKAVFVFPALCTGLAVLFSLSITGIGKNISRWTHGIIAIVPVIIAALGATDFVVAGVTRGDGGVYGIVFGPLIFLYFAYHLTYLCSLVPIFIKAFRNSEHSRLVRLQYVIAGLFSTFALILLTNLVMPFLFHSYALVGVGPYATLILITSFAYAIVKHRLFDLRLVVAKSVAYVLLLATLVTIFVMSIFFISNLFFPASTQDTGQMIVNIFVALALSVAFQPLKRFFQHITNRIFFRDNYDSQVVLNNFSKILVSERELDRILKRALAELCDDLHIEFAQLIVFNNERVYRVEHYGKLPKRLMVAPELARLAVPMLIADELPEGDRKRVMDDHNIRISLMLRTREEFIGYLLLGDKLSGDIYSSQDINLLEIIGKELAVAILNAKAYAQIQEFNLTLQARVDHATNRLRVANRHLKELDRAKDEFISMASHQLRTPLTTIKGYLSMMLEGDAGKLTKPQAEFVGYAFGSSERMVNLISDLLNVSRLSAGRFLIQTKPTDMVAMIADEVRQLETHATAKHIKLVFEKPDHALPPAEIDDNKTRQVVMNFIDNAIYYTQKGEVRVVLEQSGDRVRLEVHDSGIGVPEKAKKHLFTKFFRADNAQVTRPDGTGLGLYLAKRVVEDQGGTIVFNSVEGKGSTFGFELPFKPVKPIHEVAHASKS